MNTQGRRDVWTVSEVLLKEIEIEEAGIKVNIIMLMVFYLERET